jgi:hypothetical protein
MHQNGLINTTVINSSLTIRLKHLEDCYYNFVPEFMLESKNCGCDQSNLDTRANQKLKAIYFLLEKYK